MPEQDDKLEPAVPGNKNEDRRFWRSLASDKQQPETHQEQGSDRTVGAHKHDAPDPPLADTGPDAVDLTPGDEQRLNPAEQAARREALRNMLHRSEARHKNVRRKRRPVLTAGTQVRVASGPHIGEEGTILDADYIESRVLLALGGNQTPTWVKFDQVTGPRRKN